MQNPQSYVNSNIAGFVNLLEIPKAANPQPSIVWASSSSVYGLNTQNPFSESHRTDQQASLYAATKIGQVAQFIYQNGDEFSVQDARLEQMCAFGGRSNSRQRSLDLSITLLMFPNMHVIRGWYVVGRFNLSLYVLIRRLRIVMAYWLAILGENPDDYIWYQNGPRTTIT
ncbi:hypothetical protein LguiB_005088 [Lonicera macranthoides]